MTTLGIILASLSSHTAFVSFSFLRYRMGTALSPPSNMKYAETDKALTRALDTEYSHHPSMEARQSSASGDKAGPVLTSRA